LKNRYVLVEGDTNVRPCKNEESNSIPCELEATTSAAVVSNTFTFSEPLVENDDEEPSDGRFFKLLCSSDSFEISVESIGPGEVNSDTLVKLSSSVSHNDDCEMLYSESLSFVESLKMSDTRNGGGKQH
jgi:hypothetical protein